MIAQYEYLEESDFSTILDEDVEFTGEVDTQEPNLIKGTIEESKIKATVLVVIQSGTISGDISSDVLSVLGTCRGEMRIHDTLTLLQSGRIEGKVRTNKLIVGEGGILNGECSVSPKSNS